MSSQIYHLNSSIKITYLSISRSVQTSVELHHQSKYVSFLYWQVHHAFDLLFMVISEF